MTRRRCALSALVAVACLWGARTLLLAPYPTEQLDRTRGGPLLVLDRHGELLRSVRARDGRPGRAHWVALDAIASHAVLTLLASEDQAFFEHRGVDPNSVLRALWLNLRAGGIAYGGSTLTMQLMKMIHSPGKPRTLVNKLREALLALRVERALGKRAILEQYLNRAYYGHGAYGIEAAAQRYFGKPAAALSAGEATFLCVLPRNPSLYDPLTHRDRALARRQHMLSLLVRQGKLSAAEADAAAHEPLALGLHEPAYAASHFVDWVLRELPAATRAQGGSVRTSLDAGLQRALERRTAEHVAELRARGVAQAAVVVLDTQSGEVLAMVGGAGAPGAGDQLNLATWRRHPGSALKPFVYATAIEQGANPASIAFDVYDVPSRYLIHGIPPREHGPVRYREALAGSYNLAAVHVLEQVGIARVMDKLVRAGAGELPGTSEDYGLRLALGATKTRLVDLASAYRVFARGGRTAPARAVLELIGADGARSAPPAPLEQQVFSSQAAWLTLDMLADPEARRPMFGQELPADLPYRVAVKTGTARGFGDTVAVFVTRELTVAAWTGRADGGSTEGLLGMEGAAPLARAALLLASDGRALSLPRAPAGLEQVELCPLSGLRPGPSCPHRKRELVIAGHAPTAECSWHAHAGGELALHYPRELDGWARRQGGRRP